MKKILVCSTVIFLVALCKPASAQFEKSDNNVKEQPKWGPVGHEFVEYYYLPDIETYYYVPGKQFIYQSGGYWTFSSSLPEANKHYDLRSANKVVINEPGAYRYFADHKNKYGNGSSNAAINKDRQPANEDKQVVSSEKKSG
jgi:hypothetical protein